MIIIDCSGRAPLGDLYKNKYNKGALNGATTTNIKYKNEEINNE